MQGSCDGVLGYLSEVLRRVVFKALAFIPDSNIERNKLLFGWRPDGIVPITFACLRFSQNNNVKVNGLIGAPELTSESRE